MMASSRSITTKYTTINARMFSFLSKPPLILFLVHILSLSRSQLEVNWVAENMNFKNTTPVRTWIINRCKIDNDRIGSDTENVMKEIAEIQNWTLPV